MTAAPVSLEKRGNVAWLTLSGAPLDGRALGNLASLCDAVAEDGALRCVVVTGTGDRFATGWDWDALRGGEGSLLETATAWGLPGDVFGCLAELPQPVIAAVNGPAHSAGMELALACDVRLAAEAATFRLPEIGLGLLPLAGGVQRLSRAVGRGRALEMVLSGDEVDAAEALRIGLVSAVAADVAAEAERVAGRIAEQGPIATRYAKEAVARGLEMPLQQALRLETDLTVILQTTEDRAEGVRAFMEKRKPEFRGR